MLLLCRVDGVLWQQCELSRRWRAGCREFAWLPQAAVCSCARLSSSGSRLEAVRNRCASSWLRYGGSISRPSYCVRAGCVSSALGVHFVSVTDILASTDARQVHDTQGCGRRRAPKTRCTVTSVQRNHPARRLPDVLPLKRRCRSRVKLGRRSSTRIAAN